MDGYALGVDYYNSIYGTTVEVLGWDPDLQTGLFSFDFQDPAIGQALASDLYDAGADTVFPVAGLTGFGALWEAAERKAAGESVRVIGVDFDYYDFFGDPERVILTSVVKDTGVAVFNQTAALVDGTWMGDFVEEGLESGGVDIAPFHKLNRAVPGFLKNDLKSIRVGIIDGTIQTLPGAGDACGQPIPSIEPVSVVNGDVVFSQTDGTLWVYKPDSGALVEHPLPFGGVWDIQWNGPNTRLLMANTTFPRIVGLDLRTGEFTEVLCGAPLQFPLGISTDPTEPSTLWIADSAGVIRHDMASGETEVVVEPSASWFDGVAVSPDGEVYVTDGSPNLYRVAPGETNDVTLVATVDGYGLNGLVFDNEGFVFDAPGTLIATAMSPSAQVAIDAETGAFDLIDFATDMRSSEDTDFTRSGDRYVIDSGLVGDNFGVDPALYLLPRGATEVIELLRGAPLGDTVDILVARNVFPDIGEWFFNEATGHWYTLIAADTFEAAEAQAVGLGGHLVTVNDTAEQAWLYDTFDVNPFVIGLNDIGEEGNFVWTSGEPVTYTNWCPGEPSNGGPDGEDLVHMGFIDGCWNDVPNDLVGIAIVETDQAP
jgi:hypothetical protein